MIKHIVIDQVERRTFQQNNESVYSACRKKFCVYAITSFHIGKHLGTFTYAWFSIIFNIFQYFLSKLISGVYELDRRVRKLKTWRQVEIFQYNCPPFAAPPNRAAPHLNSPLSPHSRPLQIHSLAAVSLAPGRTSPPLQVAAAPPLPYHHRRRVNRPVARAHPGKSTSCRLPVKFT